MLLAWTMVLETFKDSTDEVSYGKINLAPLIYLDDIVRMSNSVKTVQAGLTKRESLAEFKLLDYNLDKSCFMVFYRK